MASPSSPSMPNPSAENHMPVVLRSTLSPVSVKLDRENYIIWNLQFAGQSVFDDELVLFILGGVGSYYESMVMILTSKDSVSLT